MTISEPSSSMIQRPTVANSSSTVFSITEESMTVNNLISFWQSHCMLTPQNHLCNVNLHSFSNLWKSHSAATFFHPLISPWECTKQIWQQVCSIAAQNCTNLPYCTQLNNLLSERHLLWYSQAGILFMSGRKQHKILDLFFFVPHLRDLQVILCCLLPMINTQPDSGLDFHHTLLILSF